MMWNCVIFFFCKQKTAYEMRISDWSSDVCSSDLAATFLTSLPAVAAEPLTAEQKAAVQAIVRDYIVEHPEVVLEALQAMDARQKAAEKRSEERRVGKECVSTCR